MANKKTKKEDKDFFLHQIIEAMKMSKGVYRNEVYLLIAISTVTMLFDKFKLFKFLEDREITLKDYEKWFEKPAKEAGYDELFYSKLFGEECKNEKK